MKLTLLTLLTCGILFADANGPCKDDGPKICPNEKFGKGQMFECLSKNVEKLSPVCKKHIEEMLEYKKICAPEISKYCKGKPFYCLYDLPKEGKKISQDCMKQLK